MAVTALLLLRGSRQKHGGGRLAVWRRLMEARVHCVNDASKGGYAANNEMVCMNIRAEFGLWNASAK